MWGGGGWGDGGMGIVGGLKVRIEEVLLVGWSWVVWILRQRLLFIWVMFI
jgi:hypothetical protein